jgi:hypothetical protein
MGGQSGEQHVAPFAMRRLVAKDCGLRLLWAAVILVHPGNPWLL